MLKKQNSGENPIASQKEQYKIYYWKYDDGSRGVVVRHRLTNGKKEWEICKQPMSKKELERYIQEHRKEKEANIAQQKCYIPAGLSFLTPSYLPPKRCKSNR